MHLGVASRQRSVVLAGVREVFGLGTMNAEVCFVNKWQQEQTPERQAPEERGGKKDFLLTVYGEERAMLMMSWRAGWLRTLTKQKGQHTAAQGRLTMEQ